MAAEQFLQSLQTSLEKAVEVRDGLVRCLQIGNLPAQREIEEYVQDLDIYINANRRISMQCLELYAPGPQTIAQDAKKIIGAN